MSVFQHCRLDAALYFSHSRLFFHPILQTNIRQGLLKSLQNKGLIGAFKTGIPIQNIFVAVSASIQLPLVPNYSLS